MSIKRDLLKEKLLNSKSFNTVYLVKEDEERVRREQMDLLTELLCDDKHKAARGEVFNFLKKEKKAVDLLIRAIGEATVDKKKLIAACWEGDLDCDRYLALFTQLTLNDTFEVALEAFTTIENMRKIEPVEAGALLEKVNTALHQQADPGRKVLASDLAEFLKKHIPNN